MSVQRRIFPGIILAVLGLLPRPATGQGSIGPLHQIHGGGDLSASATAGPLAFFTTSPLGLDGAPGFLRSDGTPLGTFSIDPRGPFTAQGKAYIRFANSHGPLLFFTCALHQAPEDRGLWRSDGTLAGTFPVTEGLSLAIDTGSPELPVTLSVPETGLEFFSAGPRSQSPDFELWVTDGTAEGTRLVADLNPEGPSNPRRMIAFGGRLFFLADTPEGRELWRSDGTPEGTERVLDLHEPGAAISLAEAGGALFVLVDSEAGLEVWRSDGTEAGTERVLELPLRLDSHRAAGRRLFIAARDAAEGREMWAVDGGTGETVQVLQRARSGDFRMLAVGDRVAFAGEDDHGREPWWSDGTPEGTHRIADICPGPCSSSPSFVGTYGERAVFGAMDGVSGHEPWLTDGTAAVTWQLGDLCPGECDSFVERARELGGWLLLKTFDGSFWVSDGSRDGAWSVGDFDSSADWVFLPGRVLVTDRFQFHGSVGFLWSLPVTAPPTPQGSWLESAGVPGFRFQVRIDGQTLGRQEPACMARTLCVSGALPGRSEVFLQVSPSKPKGSLWPAVVKLTTAAVEVWALQTATGHLRHYRLDATDPAGSTLEGILDREGFRALPGALESAMEEAKARTPQPPGRWIESKAVPGFRVQARLMSGGKKRILGKQPCMAETFCLGLEQTELLVRVSGLQPALARFNPATVEVWVQQRKTGKIRYYRLPADSSQLDGHLDRQGFKP